MSKKKEPVEADAAFVEDIGDGSYRVTLGCTMKTEDGEVDTLVCRPLTMGSMRGLKDEWSEFDTTAHLVQESCGITGRMFDSLTPVAGKRLSGAIVKYFLAPE